MKKALAGLLGLIAIFVVIALVGPVVVDWNRYKPQIAKQVERATGRQVTIDGDIALSLLPAPTFALEDLRVANTPGAVAPDMLRLKTLEVRIALGALLTGRIRVESIVLVEPHFALEVSPDGRRNWAFQPATGAAMAASDEGGIGLLVGDVTLDRLAIENGTVSYLDVATGTVARAEAVSAEFWARSIRGPFGGRGNFTYRGLQSDFRVALGRLKRSREIPLSMALEVEGASASFEGRFGLEGDGPQVAGRLQLEGENLKQLAASAFGGAVPSQVSKWLPGRPFLLEGDIDGDGRRVTIDDLSVGLGDIRATGAAKLVLDAPLRAEVRLSVGTINLDKLLVEWAAVLPPPVNRGGVFLASTATQTVWPPAPTTGVAIPSGVEGRLDLSVDAIIYRGRVVQNAHLGVVAEAGSLSIADASASLPGGSDFVVTGRLDSAAGKPRFVGGFEARSRHARVLFEWIGANLANLPADRLRTFTLTGDLAGTPDEIGLSNLDLLLDDSRATGAATVALSGRPAIGIDLVLDGLDIDAYMPAAEVGRAVRTTQAEQAPRGGATGETEASPEATPAPESPFAALKMLENFDVNIVARIGSLTVNKQRIKGLELDGRVTEGRVQLDKLAVKDFAGASGQITALLQELASNPTLDASFDLMAPDAARLLKAVGMTPPDSVARAGAMSARGTVKGTAESLKIDAVVTAFAGQALFAGTISDLAAGPGWDLRVDADYPDLRPVLEALGIEVAAGDLGPFAVAGTTRGTKEMLSLNGEVTTGAGKMTVNGEVANLAAALPRFELSLKAKQLKPQFLAALIDDVRVRGVLSGLTGLDANIRAKGTRDDLEVILDGVEARGFAGAATFSGRIVGAIDAPHWKVRLDASYPELSPLIAAMGTEAAEGLGELGGFTVRGTSEGTPTRLELDATMGIGAGEMTFTGGVDDPFDTGRRVDLAVVLRGLRPRFLAPFAPDSWTRKLIAGIDGVDGRLAVEGSVDAMNITLDSVKLRGFGGRVVVAGDVGDATGNGMVDVTVELERLQPKLMAGLVENATLRRVLSQVASLSGRLAAKGPLSGPELQLRNVEAQAFGGNFAVSGFVADLTTKPRMKLAVSGQSLDTLGLIRTVDPVYQPAAALGALGFDATVTGDGRVVHVTDLVGTLGHTNFSGTIQALLTEPRPVLDINLDLDDFDLDPFLPAEPQ